ncbi:MAG: hypothetical protein EGS41_08670 [Prevotella sp.]|nr:hypothetical protein [Prevotella sp.]
MNKIQLTEKTSKMVLATLMWLFCQATMFSQEFSVASFQVLPNDVSAFIHHVRDLNDEACALIKVEAPSDFAFSTPLGIVKRKDEVGEIWLYVPRGTKMLTLKHPQWGVIRDYKLGKPLESRMTYEMKLNLPKPAIAEKHDTIIQIKTVTDTIAIPQAKPKMALSIYALATIALHQDGPSYGIFFAMMHRHGFFLHASSDFKSIGKTEGNCDKDGNIAQTNDKPYYTGKTRHSNYTITAGAIHHIYKSLRIFEGIGYGRSATAWQMGESEGGGYLLNDGLTHKGVAGEVGILGSIGRLTLSASAITIAGKQWQGSIGIGIKL